MKTAALTEVVKPEARKRRAMKDLQLKNISTTEDSRVEYQVRTVRNGEVKRGDVVEGEC